MIVENATSPKVEIYRFDPTNGNQKLVISSLQPVTTTDAVALQTYDAALSVLKYYKESFGRNSFDGKGAPVKVVIGYREEPNTPLNNAFWSSSDKTMYFGDGDGKIFTPLGTAPDVFSHEFTHAVIDSEVKLQYTGEQGGIHESFADILSTGVDNNLQIGESVFTPHISGDSIRDLPNLKVNHVSKLNLGEVEPHIMSEPLSTAAMRAAESIGIDKVRRIWYDSVIGLKNHSGFSGAREATIGAAKALYGDAVSASVRQAWDAVGILTNRGTKKEST